MTAYNKPDHWSIRAQKEGYPARSVYKLQEIDGKFKLFGRNGARNSAGPLRILDLGAAPGSWSLYILKKFGQGVFLAAADLSPLSLKASQLFSGANVFFVQGDIYDETVRSALLEKGPYDAVISDAAPATTGNRSVDTSRSLALAEAALSYGEAGLRAGGNFVVKVFQGAGTGEFLKRIKERFTGAKSYKPEACRSNSFETYYLGLGKKD
ncbi:MAG: RlmE family RNA methyltransferase [Spirochaetaceae bacterium]|jgi:23S rRNA (uridine2552-2'-O)-methyltransferase|nr:RlmE family RNA methyltransferase [Spirochaetaceae bacterium]